MSRHRSAVKPVVHRQSLRAAALTSSAETVSATPAVEFCGAMQGLAIPRLRDLILALLVKAEQQLLRKLGTLLHSQTQGGLFKCFGVHGFSFTTTARHVLRDAALQLQCLSVPRIQFLGQRFEPPLEVPVAHVFARCDANLTAGIERPALRSDLGKRRGFAQAGYVTVRQPLSPGPTFRHSTPSSRRRIAWSCGSAGRSSPSTSWSGTGRWWCRFRRYRAARCRAGCASDPIGAAPSARAKRAAVADAARRRQTTAGQNAG
jgi:hypothetical protein